MRMYLMAFDALHADRKAKPKKDGKTSVDKWATGRDMFDWWISGKGSPKPDEKQGCLQVQ